MTRPSDTKGASSDARKLWPTAALPESIASAVRIDSRSPAGIVTSCGSAGLLCSRAAASAGVELATAGGGVVWAGWTPAPGEDTAAAVFPELPEGELANEFPGTLAGP